MLVCTIPSQAELDKDSAFTGDRVGASRLQILGGATKEPPISMEFAGVSDVRVLQQRGSAVQQELAKKTAELQAAEASKRKVEREKASLLQARASQHPHHRPSPLAPQPSPLSLLTPRPSPLAPHPSPPPHSLSPSSLLPGRYLIVITAVTGPRGALRAAGVAQDFG